ncbi:hypothetical protein FRUB_00971 [Fimbriiglobus ruber]|uniref:Uncharacterized protein n=1 Tax=Fimbriiglobus ruber TaxID=1908690 RepID=A0A225E117_9BACT|nr:hypothetical protein FRUB_00971 [Fimbriiglobus ruber]
MRGELPDPDGYQDETIRKEILKAQEHYKRRANAFVCQLGSTQVSSRQPFINVEKSTKLTKNQLKDLLAIADLGGYDLFYDGQTTDFDCWSG